MATKTVYEVRRADGRFLMSFDSRDIADETAERYFGTVVPRLCDTDTGKLIPEGAPAVAAEMRTHIGTLDVGPNSVVVEVVKRNVTVHIGNGLCFTLGSGAAEWLAGRLTAAATEIEIAERVARAAKARR